ncbi:uncharacterized protein [Dermacentor andersoni]|uniref:uncharacterized protein n=1 Tax=Dermacentor andersoni TaxID=34620 RepID=UPI0021555AA3|nr:uncharacterized protein LOC126545477 [Dermacentor andersoni]
MASRNRRRHRRAGLQFGGAPSQPSFHHGMSGGGDDYPEWQDLRQKLNFIRSHRQEQSQHRPADSHDTQLGSSKTSVHGLEEPRGPEMQVPIVRKRTRITSEEESKNRENDTTECKTARQINTDEEQHGAVGKIWHSSVMTDSCNNLIMGKTMESHQSPHMHHELLLTKGDLQGRLSSAKAPDFRGSEEQQTSMINTQMAKKHRLSKSEGDSECVVSDNEEEEVFHQPRTDEHRRNIVCKTWNKDLIAKPDHDLTTFHYQRPSLYTDPVDDAPDSMNVKHETCHNDPEHNKAAKRPRIDTTGLKKEELERQKEVTEPQDKNEYCLRWLQWGVGRAEAEDVDLPHDQGIHTPRRRRRSAQAMVSDCRHDQWRIDDEMGADAESSSSEHQPKRQKLQSPDHFCAHPQDRPSSEARSEDQQVLQELLERFKKLCKPP